MIGPVQPCKGQSHSADEASSAFQRVKEESGVSVTALVCTLDEEESLPQVLPRIPDWVDEALLVDGHSKDQTVDIALSLRPDTRVVYQPGRGKGDALRFGVQQASGDIIVTLDADGETDPAEMENFIKPLLDGCDFAKGSRLATGRPLRMPWYRWFGNKALASTFNILYGTRFTDICSGYTAFWRTAFLQLPLTYDNCEMEQEMLVAIRKAGMNIVEVPHSSDGRIAGSSKVSGVKQGFIDWLTIIKARFGD